jgi:hypothetical protein
MRAKGAVSGYDYKRGSRDKCASCGMVTIGYLAILGGKLTICPICRDTSDRRMWDAIAMMELAQRPSIVPTAEQFWTHEIMMTSSGTWAGMLGLNTVHEVDALTAQICAWIPDHLNVMWKSWRDCYQDWVEWTNEHGAADELASIADNSLENQETRPE